MRHNLTNSAVSGSGGLRQMRRFSGPNVVILTRADRPPVPSLVGQPDKEEAASAETESGLGAKRELRGMSNKSSLNLARLLSTLDWSKHGQCLHVSLTYRAEFPRAKADLLKAKQALCMFFKRAGACGIWRLEYQKRFAPHWHVLVWIGDRCPGDFEQCVRDWWGRYSGNDHVRGVHVTSGTEGRAAWYLAMHAAKKEQSPPFNVGRWWGYIDREKFLGAVDLHQVADVDERERVWWLRLYRRRTGVRTRQAQGVSWFLPRHWQGIVSRWVSATIERERDERHGLRRDIQRTIDRFNRRKGDPS